MAKVRLYGDTSGYVDLKAPDVAGDVTITLPNTTGPFATETYVDSAIAAIPEIAGIGSNVVFASDSSNQTTTSGTFVDITNVSVSITPSSATSKILVICVLTTWSERFEQNSTDSYFQLTDSSNVALQGAEGMRVGSTNTLRVGGAGTSFRIYSPVTLVGLDSPATTSPVTYKARFRRGATTAGVDGATNTSKIYAIEVAA